MSQVIDIDIIFRDTFLTVLQLRSGVTTSDGVKLYQNAKYQIENVRKILRDANFSNSDIDLISYAQCALLDETVMNRHLENVHDAAYQTWIGLPLQIHFFNTLEAGDKIFQSIKDVLNQGRPNPVVLTSFHRILLLGFCGKYGKNIDHPERLEIMQKLTMLINELNAYPMQAEPDDTVIGKSKRKLWRPSRRFVNWSLVCISAVSVVGLWNFYDYSLDQQINNTIPMQSIRNNSNVYPIGNETKQLLDEGLKSSSEEVINKPSEGDLNQPVEAPNAPVEVPNKPAESPEKPAESPEKPAENLSIPNYFNITPEAQNVPNQPITQSYESATKVMGPKVSKYNTSNFLSNINDLFFLGSLDNRYKSSLSQQSISTYSYRGNITATQFTYYYNVYGVNLVGV